jgi:hypothetical protein
MKELTQFQRFLLGLSEHSSRGFGLFVSQNEGLWKIFVRISCKKISLIYHRKKINTPNYLKIFLMKKKIRVKRLRRKKKFLVPQISQLLHLYQKRLFAFTKQS